MESAANAPVLAGLGLGLALASAPGPVQAVLLTESVRGGIGRGFSALAGASGTFALLLVALALGLSVAAPGGTALRVLEVVGGAFLIWLAIDGLRSGHRIREVDGERRGLPPVARGALSILLNPGAWIFLGAVASPLLTEATQAAGTGAAVLTAAALVAGAAAGDAAVVLLGGLGLRTAGDRVVLWVGRVLAVLLAGLGVWLILQGVMG
jgi:threonine/homoserine/homoserine lactone efflux protein